jgi:hypothetical protein
MRPFQYHIRGSVIHARGLPFGGALGGFGLGLFQIPNNRIVFASALAERSAAAGGLQGSVRLAGQAFGSLMMSRSWPAHPLRSRRASRRGWRLCAVAAALGSALAMQRSAHPVSLRWFIGFEKGEVS